jgi:hypothetical protein
VGCQPCIPTQPAAPSGPLVGDLWIDNSTGPPYQLREWNGATWANVGVTTGGGAGSAQAIFAPFVAPPAAAGWTWVNQGAATLVDVAVGLQLTSASPGGQLRGVVLAVPAPPWTRTAVFAASGGLAAGTGAGLWFRESSSGKVCAHYFNLLAGVGQHEHWTSPTAFSASPASPIAFDDYRNVAGLCWLRLADDGVNRIWSVSHDGQTYFARGSEARASFLTANQVGILVRPESAVNGLTLLSWS